MSAVAERVAVVRFAREAVATVIGEIPSLMHAHWNEVGHYRDIPIDPDFERYAKAEREGVLRLYTARTDHLVGYAVYILGTALHYQDVITAQQATLFLHPDARKQRTGPEFVMYTEEALRRDGVQIIVQHVKAGTTEKGKRRAQAFLRVLTGTGYQVQDYLCTKRL